MNKLQIARDKWLQAQALAVEAKVEYLKTIELAERTLNVVPPNNRVYVSCLLRKQAE